MRKQSRQRKIEIFRLEDRVLFEAAGAAEAVEAVENANNPNPDQQHDISESERQEKVAQSVAKYAGPDGAAIQDPGAPVQDQGAGLTRPDAIQQDPAQKLVEGSGDFSDVPDVTQEHSTELSDFLNADFSDTSDTTLSFSDSLSSDSDAHELIVVDADAAKDFDPGTLSDNAEVLVLDGDSDAMDQINTYLDSHDGKYDSIRFVVDGDSDADSAPDHLELNGKEVSASDLDAVRDHLADDGALTVAAADDAAPAYALTPDGDLELVHADDLHDTVIHPEIDENITIDASANALDSALSSPVGDGREELVIINSNMADKDVVLSQLGGRDVLEIDPSQDALSQIQDYLDANPDTQYDAIHILTHGNDGGLVLGSDYISDAADFSVFSGHIAENGDLMLYGCNMAATEKGQLFIQDIADVVGADVAASTDVTGSMDYNGNWTLEYNTGVIETTAITLDASWNHRLTVYTVDGEGDGSNDTYSSLLDLYNAQKDNFTAGDSIVFTISDTSMAGSTFTVANGNLMLIAEGSVEITANFSVAGNSSTTDLVLGDNITVNGSISVNEFGELGINSGAVVNGDITSTGTVNVAGTLNGDLSGGEIFIGTDSDHQGTVTGTVSNFNSLTLFGSIGQLDIADQPVDFSTHPASGSIGSVTIDGTGWGYLTINDTVTLGTGTGTAAEISNGTLNVEGGTVGGSVSLTDGAFNLSGGAVNGTVSLTGGAFNMTGDTSIDSTGTALNVGSGATAAIDTTGSISGAVVNAGSMTVSSLAGGLNGTLENSGTLGISSSLTITNDGTAAPVGIANSGTLTLDANVETLFTGASIAGNVTGISNTGTLTLNAGGGLALNVTPANVSGTIYGVSNSGTMVFNGGSVTNTNSSGTNAGYGVYQTGASSSLNIQSASAISGFYFAFGRGTGASQLSTSELALMDVADNTYAMLASIQVVGGGADASQFEFNTINEALSFVSLNSSLAAEIQFNLDSAYTSDWTAATTISSSQTLTSNLISISGSSSITDVTVASGVTLNISNPVTVISNGMPQGSSNALALNNIALTVSAGAALNIGTVVTGTDLSLVNNGTFAVNASGDLSITSNASGNFAVITNTGILTIAGTLSVTDGTISSTGIFTALYNNGASAKVEVTGEMNVSAASRLLFGIANNVGTVTVTGGEVSMTGVRTANSATILNSYNNGANLLTITEDARVSLSASSSAVAYAIVNSDVTKITNSFISASGTGSIGLLNDTTGDVTFTVSKNPDDTITATSFEDYGSQVYGIIGGAYSVYNFAKFTASITSSLSPMYTGGTLKNAPVMYFGGTVYTEAKGGDGKTVTILNGATVNGNIENLATATVVLNDVYLHGSLLNTGSNVYVTGDFHSADFSVGNTYIVGSAVDIYIINSEYGQTHSYGNIYFGSMLASSGYGSNDITFSANQTYSFINLGGVMRIVNFSSLSSEKYPVSIFNSGEFYLDATNAQGLAENGAYDLYVSASIMQLETGLNVTDGGIYNYNQNAYNPAYFVKNAMELTNLNIRNTQANSTAVTNHSGNLVITGGSLQGTYSGLDALSDLAISGSWQLGTAKVYIYTPITTLTNVEKIAGQAYSIRNTGEMTLSGADTAFGYTVLTNSLDFATQSYSGDYTAVFNASTTVYLTEQYTSDSDIYNTLAAYAVNPVQQAQSTSWTWNAKNSSGATQGNMAVAYISADNMYAKTDFTITPSSTYSRTSGNITLIDWHYGNYQVTADLTLDYVAFQATVSTATTTALGNWGNLTVTNINNDPSYQFSGFTVSLNNGSYSDSRPMYFWASDYAVANKVGLRTPAWQSGQSGTYTAALYSSAPVIADVTVDFDLQSGKIWTVNDTVVGTITLRGIKVSPDAADYEYNGRLVIAGAPFTVDYGKTLNLVNFSAEGVDGDGIVNYGKLGIYNGVDENGNGGWKGGSDASISVSNGIAIYNHGTVRMINGAVLDSRIGIYNEADAGVLSVINSTIAGNSEWAIVSNKKGASSEGATNFLVADTTIANNGNGIQINNAGVLTLVNSIVLNLGGTDISLNGGASLFADTTGSNIYGNDSKDTEAKLNAVFGTTTPTLSTAGNVFALVENSTALTGGIAFSYTVDANGVYSFYSNSSAGEVNVTWDKLGNERTTQIGSYVLTGTPTPPTPTTSAIVVNTTEDYGGTITAETILAKVNDKNAEYSLREVIWAIQNQGELGMDLGTEVQFDWTVLGKDFTLAVSDGTIDINSDIAVTIDIPESYSVTIDASGNTGSAFTVTNGADLSMTNLTIEGANVAGNGGAINIADGTVTLKDLILTNGIAASGGAVYIASNSTLNGSNVTFQGNQAASGSGGAVYVASGGTMTVTDASFSGNSASVSGGAIYNNGVVQLSGTNTFANNTSVNGGAVYNQGSAFSVTNGTFSSNTATGGNGGAVYNNGGTLTVTGGTFSQNTAIGDGGAIYTTGSAVVSGSAFTGNQAVNGGAIYNMGSAVVSGSFSSNTAAGGNGGAIYSGGSSLTVAGGSFTGNEALAGDGGAICNAAGSLTVSGTPSFTGNQAGGDGGAIYTGGDGDLSGSFSQNTAAGEGGAVYVGGDLTVNGGGFTSNVAGGDGGAVYAGGDVTLSNLAFTGNQANGTGGAVYAAGSVSASNVSFSGNTVADGMDGAAIRADGNALTLTDSSFTGHSNGNSVVFAENAVNAVLNGVTMSGNTVSGAVLNVSNAAATIEKSAFFNNSASQVLSVGSSLYLITSTVAQGTGTVSGNLVSGTGSMTILNSTLTGSSPNAIVQGNGSGTLRLINSILVGTDASQQLFAGFTEVGAAYSIFSNADLNGVNDENLFGLAYADVFGSNTVSADGSIALASDSPAWTGVWSGYDKTTGALYYSVRPDALYPRYGIDTVDWMAFGGGSVSRPGAGVTIVASGLNGGTLPSIGSYWAPQNVPTLGIGPGVNITFVNPSWNGIGWNNNDTYNLVSDFLFMNPGFLLNFRSETAFGGNWSYDFIHAFDDRYSTMSGFSVTGGRFDLGFVPSGENYISLNVNGYRSDDFTRYSTTPYLSDGTPLIPEELESMNPETAAPENEGSFDLPEGLEAKVISYLGRAEIFKNDFDRALDQLLALNV